jgi:hypothetical protein
MVAVIVVALTHVDVSVVLFHWTSASFSKLEPYKTRLTPEVPAAALEGAIAVRAGAFAFPPPPPPPSVLPPVFDPPPQATSAKTRNEHRATLGSTNEPRAISVVINVSVVGRRIYHVAS